MEKEGQVGKFLVGENQVFNKIMLPTYLEFTKVGMTIAWFLPESLHHAERESRGTESR